MSWILELVELIGKLKFHEIVYEFQQGIYLRNGRVLDTKKRKLTEEEKVHVESLESKLIDEYGLSSFLPFRRPKLPADYKTSWVTGLPLHKDRFSKILRRGFYLHIPFIDDIIKDSKQERVLNLANISVPTADKESKVVMVSCNIRYELEDLYKAYTAVHDYEVSLKDYTLSILAKHSRGKSFDEWRTPEVVSDLEDAVLDELRELVTEKWGLKVHKVYVTDNVACNIQRLMHEGIDGAKNTVNPAYTAPAG